MSDPRPSAILGFPHPPMALHVEPWTDGFPLLRLRAESNHVAIEILDLNLVRPLEVGWPLTDLCSLGAILLEERLDVGDADPQPRAKVPLVAFDEEDGAGVA